MKSATVPMIPVTRRGGLAPVQIAEEIQPRQCPEAVMDTILDHLGKGNLEEIKRIPMESGVLYLAEIDLPGRRKRTLQISVDGTLLKTIDGIHLGDLPRRVKSALDPFLTVATHFDSADRIVSLGKTEFHVDLDLVDDVDLHLVLGEGGEILRHREVADF